MPDDLSDEAQLPIDDEIEAVLRERDASRLDRSRRTLLGLMRALARVRARKQARADWFEMVVREAAAAGASDTQAEDWLSASIEAIAPDFLLEGSKHVDVPGAGRIQYRDTPAGLRIADAEAFMASLGADERARLVEQRPHLLTTEAKKYAEAVMAESAEILPGVERTEAQRTATMYPSQSEKRQQQ